jgi:hypothetical protein
MQCPATACIRAGKGEDRSGVPRAHAHTGAFCAADGFAAEALGLAVPPSILLRAEVIE